MYGAMSLAQLKLRCITCSGRKSVRVTHIPVMNKCFACIHMSYLCAKYEDEEKS